MKKGSITIFASLCLMLVASLILSLLESARVYGLNHYVKLKSELGTASVCAEYQQKIWEDYNLLLLDAGYGTEEIQPDMVSSSAQNIVARNLKLEQDSRYTSGLNLFGLEVDQAVLSDYQILTDYKGEVFLNLVATIMKENLTYDVASKIFDEYSQNETVEAENNNVSESVEKAEQMIADAETQLEEENQGQIQREEVEENPFEVIKAIKTNTTLELVLQDQLELSNKAVNLDQRLEIRELQQGNQKLNNKDDTWYRKLLVLSYIDKYYAAYTEPLENHVLDYEMEYLLGGCKSDKENLEKVVERLLVIREAANISYLVSDNQKMIAARSLATAISGFTGNPLIVKAVETAIVGVWAFLESILDIRTLLAGGKIAPIKNAEQWTMDITHLADSFQRNTKAKECQNGLEYKEYLNQLLFLEKDQRLAYRMMDIIELNITSMETYQNCHMDHMIVAGTVEYTYMAQPLFSELVVIGSKWTDLFCFTREEAFSYVP